MILALKKLVYITAIWFIVSLALAGCIEQPKRLSQDQVLDLVWTDFRPSTSSQNRSNWDNVEVSLVSGREVVREFSAVPISRCPGPPLPENKAIRASSQYWMVKVMPKPIDLKASAASPTADKVIVPEPLFESASYLVDATSGEIVARRYFCQK